MATRAALITEADLRRMARVVRKEGVDVRVEFGLDGTRALCMTPATAGQSKSSNGFDDAL